MRPCAAFSRDGQHIIFVTEDEKSVWSTATGKLVLSLPAGKAATCAAFSPSGHQIACTMDDGMIELWDTKTGDPAIETFSCQSDEPFYIAFAPDGLQIISLAFDRIVRIFNASTGMCVWMASGLGDDAILAVDFSSSTQRVVAGSPSNLRVWNTNVTDGEPSAIAILKGHTESIFSVAISPDGHRIASGSDDSTLRVWDVEHAITSLKNGEDGNDHDLYRVAERDGWVRGRNSELLYWIPPHNRIGLWSPSTISIMNRRNTRLDFTQFLHGTSWKQCYVALDM
jgi:WD40 repeat protein